MKTNLTAIFCSIVVLFFTACDKAVDSQAPDEQKYYEFKGKIAQSYEDSEEWWPPKTRPPEDAVWELYHVAEDFSESTDLADQHPEKLEELKKIFEEEAWANQVYPMYDDMLSRLNKVNYVIFGDQKKFTYYAPGATRIAEKASAPVKGRSHMIETTIDLKGNEEGVIVACGGMTGGYSMYIKDGKLHFDYNFLDGVHYHLTSSKLPAGTQI